jgi:hypothetical protein
MPAPSTAAASWRLYVWRSVSVICSQTGVPYRDSSSGGRWKAESSIGSVQSMSRNGSFVDRSDAAISCSERADDPLLPE